MRDGFTRGHIGILILGILGILAASCRREPLYDETGNLMMEIAIDYEIKHTLNYPEPEKMFVGIYDIESEELLRTEYTGPKGGLIFVEPGVYDFLVYNFDTEATIIRNNEHLQTAEAYTNPVPTQVAQTYRAMIHKIKEKVREQMENAPEKAPVKTRVTEYESQPLINEPDHLFAGVDMDQEVPIRGNTVKKFTIHSNASTLLETYALTIGPINGMENIAAAEVFITGQAPSKLIASREITGVPSVLYVPVDMVATRRMRSSYLTTNFNTFGKYPGADNKVILVVKITDLDGNVTVVEEDVTDQFDDEDNDDNNINIDQEIDIELTGGGGFEPTVNLWEDNVTNISI